MTSRLKRDLVTVNMCGVLERKTSESGKYWPGQELRVDLSTSELTIVVFWGIIKSGIFKFFLDFHLHHWEDLGRRHWYLTKDKFLGREPTQNHEKRTNRPYIKQCKLGALKRSFLDQWYKTELYYCVFICHAQSACFSYVR